ncbi:hypothetical protein LguiB_014727 [Lonicera macranthoides]
MKLEKSCNIGSKKGIFTFTGIMDDPFCRVRLYPIHVMLVAELEGEVVGMVQGCIKCVGTGFGRRQVLNLGCILGLRVSPAHRRMGIALKLVQSVEEWLIQNGANYTFLATEEKNTASTNLFTLKSNYLKFTSLLIYVQPLPNSPTLKTSSDQHIEIEKLPIEEAMSLYNTHLKSKDLYPTDIESILKEKLSIGTWLCYFKEQRDQDWALFSIWNTCEAYKLQATKYYSSSSLSRVFYETINSARDNFFQCFKDLKWPMWDPIEKPFGFLFLYGICGEGERRGELMEAVWGFGLKMGESVRGCRALITEMGAFDPMGEHVPKGSTSMTCIEDLWCLKRVNANLSGGGGGEEEELNVKTNVRNVFVDPRDF